MINYHALYARQPTLAAMVRQAAQRLAAAVSAAEVLEARDLARVAYDAAKSAARLAKARQAHNDLITAIYRTQADALEIEAIAKRRLAEEYAAAQAMGEVASAGANQHQVIPSQKDLGISPKDVHEGRRLNQAEAASPGIIRATLDAKLAAGEEPTKAAVRTLIVLAAPARQEPRTVHVLTADGELELASLNRLIASFQELRRYGSAEVIFGRMNSNRRAQISAAVLREITDYLGQLARLRELEGPPGKRPVVPMRRPN